MQGQRRFKVDNLLIQIMPDFRGEGDCPSACSLDLTNYTQGCCGGGCSNVPSGTCFPCSVITNVIMPWQLQPSDIGVLRAQLQEALVRLEIQERVTNEVMAPRTAEDATLLEQHLTAALETVKAKKRELEAGR